MTGPRDEDEMEFGVGGGLDDDFDERGRFTHARAEERHRDASTHDDEHQCLEWCPICRGADMLRAAVPPELHDQLQLVQRDALLLARSLIEAHLARVQEEQRRRARERDPEDIPLD